MPKDSWNDTEHLCDLDSDLMRCAICQAKALEDLWLAELCFFRLGSLNATDSSSSIFRDSVVNTGLLVRRDMESHPAAHAEFIFTASAFRKTFVMDRIAVMVGLLCRSREAMG